jgi:hypothetical protein
MFPKLKILGGLQLQPRQPTKAVIKKVYRDIVCNFIRIVDFIFGVNSRER